MAENLIFSSLGRLSHPRISSITSSLNSLNSRFHFHCIFSVGEHSRHLTYHHDMQQASALCQPSSVTVVYPLNYNLSSLALWMVFMLTSSKRDVFLWLWGGPLHLRLAQPDHRAPPCLLSHGTPGSWRLDGASSGPPCQDLPL